jgi:hypothetical protein
MVGGARRGLAVVVCGLAGHAVLYRSLLPEEGAHSYLGWYEALIGTLSAVAVLSVAGLFTCRVLGIRGRAADLLGEALGGSRSRVGPVEAVTRLAGASLALLLAQESLESSIESRAPGIIMLTPATWLLLIAAATLFATALVFATRSCVALLEHLSATSESRLRAPRVLARPSRPRLGSDRPSPLASGRALRAPPLAS